MNVSTHEADATSVDAGTEIGLLSLAVADLARSLAYYTDVIGFDIVQQDASTATLGAHGRPLLVLIELPGAAPWPRDGRSYTGLYHFAILLPTRADLGRWLRNWLQLGFPVPGQGDHLVSEALYLEDPDGNGIEIYRDRPRDGWEWVNGQVKMGIGPVDIHGLLEDAERSGETWSGLPEGTRIGHIHLQVGDIPQAASFYHDILGFDVVVQMPSALFVSAGGYHHHIGMNIWHSKGARAAPDATAGLRFFTINFGSDDARLAVIHRLEAAGVSVTHQSDVVIAHDPWHNAIVLQVGNASPPASAASLSEAVREMSTSTRS